MKNIVIYITILSIFSFNSFAQEANTSRIEKEKEATQKVADSTIDPKSPNTKTIKSYRVEENINQRFGGYTLTYEVIDSKLIDTYDLGPNNTRVITPSYKESKQIIDPQIETLKPNGVSASKNEIQPTTTNIVVPAPKEEIKEVLKISKNEIQLTTTNIVVPTPKEEVKEVPKISEKEVADTSKKNDKFIYIHLIKVYERIAEKGYKSIEIFQKLGDSFFFDGEYAKAARWYTELFQMNAQLEPQYYDRYAHSLSVTGQKGKAEEITKKRKELFGAK